MKNLDILVKKAMENAEMPTPSNAWNDFEHYRAAANTPARKSNSLLQPLLAAGVALAVTIGGINYWASNSDVAHADTLAHNDVTEVIGQQSNTKASESSSDPAGQDGETAQSSSEAMSSDQATLSQPSSETLSMDNVTAEEKARIERINARLDRSADRLTHQNSTTASAAEVESDEKKTTQYVGKGFNLGAPALFSPDGDGRADYFMPSKLVDSNDFEMTIRDESGRVVYKTHSVDAPWSGKDMTGDTLPEGRYDWKVIVNKELKNSIFEGSVKLLRN